MKRTLPLICYLTAAIVLPAVAQAATLNDAAKDVSAFFAKNPGKTVAVLAFKHGDAKAIAEVTGVQDRLTEQLVAAGKVTVIERDRIEQVLREHQIDQSGATDKARIGQLLQADFLLTGSITPGKRGQIEISARLVEVTSLKIVATARATADRSDFGATMVTRPRGNYLGEPVVQIAILIDTSSSMDGLIDQARTQVWKIVNTLANGHREGKKPRLEVALYEYGNSSLDASQNYIRQVLPFTASLDKVSEKLFELKTNGGEEYCGAVIARALAELEWKKYDDVYRVVFIAGNEPFTQGPVDFRASMDQARAQGVFVNTIFCGNRQEGIATQWLTGAQLAQGDFHVINQDRMVQVVATPYDEEIQRLGAEYNATVIPMGNAGRQEEARMQKQDAKIAASAPASGASVERALAKNTEQYSESNSWDLTTVFRKKKGFANVKKDELPAELKGKSNAELEAYVKEKDAQRAKIQGRIDELNRKRNEYISRQAAKSAGQSDLGTAMQTSVKEQGKKSGMAF
ncbi:MAG TPA: CsgG/HfaB family protein [Turneriella sp.]|nr:CsgG/HfaB family protein [Turneriella sp.]